IIQSGILLIQFTDYQDTPYAPISIAFFVGFGFNRFVNKLNTVSKDIFQTNNKKMDTAEEASDEIEESSGEQTGSLNSSPHNK
ncbi:hypothetical protein V7139_23405, partial [Neobacillus drentensis]